ncbi:MAG TPA: DUF2892 domain-containing protein [Rhodospirillaceae bacterium]|nr:hypothetical protein [Rhodospirillaceae bacterium]MAX62773.1 hypothetical protein [Rhodospirillaceae bacterium]MBB57618.1 hypothetical protein [Rhodospirillaceae bacterium]HAE01865.1 DUF2892 domain-containing protein [Rhodospirillaceae bacterium]HAJ22315.1 DUF2892 domain-containing protein [Rhodospirillaceae bacterium]|tara:strand:+ start:87958 stop:88170 length:213 start_codon:yes stop_codon:yes gene_type:complete
MTVNVGSLDRLLRLILGAALIACALLSGLTLFDEAYVKYGTVAVGLVLIVTGLVRLCPLYSILGIRTCKL